MDDFQEFRELVREIIHEEVQTLLKEQGFARQVPGKVLSVSDDNRTCTVDIVTTKLNNILNKSGSSLKEGDTITLMDSYGSNYSNCYVSAKNGIDLETNLSVTEDIKKLDSRISSLETRVTALEKETD